MVFGCVLLVSGFFVGVLTGGEVDFALAGDCFKKILFGLKQYSTSFLLLSGRRYTLHLCLARLDFGAFLA